MELLWTLLPYYHPPPPPHTSPMSGSRSRPCVIFLLKLMQKAGLRLDSTLYNELIHHHSVLYICEIDIKSFKYWICLFPLTKENVPLTGTGIVGHCTVSVRTILETWALSQSRTIQCSVFTIHTTHTLTRSLSHCYCPGVVQNLHEMQVFRQSVFMAVVLLLRFETRLLYVKWTWCKVDVIS